ncbi:MULTISPECIES: FkbM family methyltransferase [unclassified Paenibacillus]|uniref:FkbM family methyltransferase n=1 Tax=unclassified Paenibacillus TaxID=185978 RepID=UPI002405292E|nr:MULTISPECIES: FkbM family methyltransferase [unclassified Paenibacillus]MDF9843776.1 FkbM family methyltransferase [Paenibacillus sp. PastF-2]MDF9850385.1 FkbM family methyltransferase [Paenibacillus sp. PastM-2]MDF9856912.1 FkbM family methyltransferase [Paenibacillus sp. PastF-1]MDH6482231.1 FkbM family methyltransferase [Paenibacillus sp. PastH-2]MDH6509605.1 FkbM family methyltransferase [Paenibacillus sp. PastM-3]
MSFETKLKNLLDTPFDSLIAPTLIHLTRNAVLHGKQVALYGAGEWGLNWLNYFRESGVRIDFFIDAGIGGTGVLREGLPVYLPAEAVSSNALLFVTPAILNHNPNAKKVFLDGMLETGFKVEDINFIPMAVTRALEFSQECKANVSKCVEAISLLEDNLSKSSYYDFIESVLKVKRLSSPWFDEKWQYIASELFELTESDYIVDCGAYTGDTVQQFAGMYPNLRGITAFEPSPETFETLQKSIANVSIPVTAINKAVGDVCGSTFFYLSDDPLGHRITDSVSEVTIEVSTLDTELTGIAPTFIKMDVEGSELAALRGGQETIKRHRPILAVCLYHKGEDLYEIPLYLRDQLTDYHFFVRKYSQHPFELVLYAIPSERLLK